MGRQRSTPDEQKKLGWLIHRRDKPLRNLDFLARSDMFGSNVRGLWPFCSPLVQRWDPAIALLSLRKSAFCFPEDHGRWRGSSGEAAEGVSRGVKRILRAWRAARKALLFEGFRGLWGRIRCGRKSGLVRLPRLGSRVRIPSPTPDLRCPTLRDRYRLVPKRWVTTSCRTGCRWVAGFFAPGRYSRDRSA